MTLDEQVKERLAAGDDREAATAVIQQLGPVVLSYLRPMLKDEDDVADAFSEWAERVWKGLPGFEWRSSLKTWCIRLACNVALNMKDGAHRRRVRRFASGEASALAESIRTTSAVRVERHRADLLELRKELTPEEQTLLFLRADQGLSWDEISEVLSGTGEPVSADTLAKRYERLKARLAKLARERGLVR
ncbi:MAG: sigma-70 family RNA polymerase sigma factor [Anaeromyxobacteraceae bacterium]